MSDAAVAFARAIGYQGAGTAEFVLDGRDFWFLELNARIPTSPAWHGAQRHLPFVFTGSAAASAGGLAQLLTPVDEAGPARTFAVTGAAFELLASKLMDRHLGFVGRAYTRGRPGRLQSWSHRLTVAGAAGTLFAGGRNRIAAALSGLALLGGSSPPTARRVRGRCGEHGRPGVRRGAATPTPRGAGHGEDRPARTVKHDPRPRPRGPSRYAVPVAASAGGSAATAGRACPRPHAPASAATLTPRWRSRSFPRPRYPTSDSLGTRLGKIDPVPVSEIRGGA